MADKQSYLNDREIQILKQGLVALEAVRLRAAGNKQFPELARKAFEDEVAEIRALQVKITVKELPL